MDGLGDLERKRRRRTKTHSYKQEEEEEEEKEDVPFHVCLGLLDRCCLDFLRSERQAVDQTFIRPSRKEADGLVVAPIAVPGEGGWVGGWVRR